jgi:hypothetical protein
MKQGTKTHGTEAHDTEACDALAYDALPRIIRGRGLSKIFALSYFAYALAVVVVADISYSGYSDVAGTILLFLGGFPGSLPAVLIGTWGIKDSGILWHSNAFFSVLDALGVNDKNFVALSITFVIFGVLQWWFAGVLVARIYRRIYRAVAAKALRQMNRI